MATVEEVREALKTVQDPEIHIDVINLGLIYDVIISEAGDVDIKMTLTSPFCPVGPEMVASAEDAAAKVPGVKSAKVEIVFTPTWDPAKMASDEAKDKLGIW